MKTALDPRWRHWTKTTERLAHQLVARWQAGASPRRTIVLQATGMWLATRTLLLVTTYFALTLSLFSTRQLAPQDFLTAWDKFDTVWYLNISQFGYWHPSAATFARDHGQIPTAFFPLYPLLISTLTPLFGTAHRLASALIISNLGTLAAFIGIGLFAANEDGDEASTRTIRLVAAYPMAFFLAAAYTEGVFLALAVFCLYFLRRNLWYAAAICAFFAALTRFTGVILFLPLVYEYGRAQDWWVTRPSFNSLITLRQYLLLRLHRRQLLEAPAVILSVPLGLGTYMLYLGMQFHNSTQLCQGCRSQLAAQRHAALAIAANGAARALHYAAMDLSTGAGVARPDPPAGFPGHNSGDHTAPAYLLHALHAWTADVDRRLASHLDTRHLCLGRPLSDSGSAHFSTAGPVEPAPAGTRYPARRRFPLAGSSAYSLAYHAGLYYLRSSRQKSVRARTMPQKTGEGPRRGSI